MIAAACKRLRLHAAQNPAYRPVRQIFKPFRQSASCSKACGHPHFFTGAGAGDAAGMAAGGALVKMAFTAGEILSAFASKTLTCQRCVSFSDPLKPAMPLRRMPFLPFQYVSHAGASVTPVPWNSSGDLGTMPCTIALWGSPGNPWHTAQFCL